MLTIIAAVIFSLLSAVVIAFQVALAFGAPWGELTMGGQHKGVLPLKLRIACGFSCFLIFAFTVIVLSRAGILFLNYQNISFKLIWVVVAYCAVGVFLNSVTPSPRERKVWLPVVLAMLVCSLVVA